MGQKKVIQQTSEEALKETEKLESAVSKAGQVKKEKSTGKKISKGKIYINASYNNTILTAADENGNVLAWASAGSLGFSGPKKATPFAASKMVSAVSEKLKKIGFEDIEIIVKGVGKGRDSAIKSLANQGFNITTIKDETPIPHNGTRPPKARRI